MLIVGFIPFFVNLCRLGAAVYQIFIFQKYNTGCLRYVFDPETNKTTINQVTYFLVPNIAERKLQPRLVDYQCWEWVEYPFFTLNFIGLTLHFVLLCGIGVGKVGFWLFFLIISKVLSICEQLCLFFYGQPIHSCSTGEYTQS